VKIRQVAYRKIARKSNQTPITGVYLSPKKVYREKIGEWSLVRLYRLLTFIALSVCDEITGIRRFLTGTTGMSLVVKALNFALRTFATSFARVTSSLKNSLIIIIMKKRWEPI